MLSITGLKTYIPLWMKPLIRPFYFFTKKLINLRVVHGPLKYSNNGLYTVHNSDFMKDMNFMSAYNKANHQTGFVHPAPWRVFVNCWAIKRAVHECKGDLIECGTWKGTTAYAGMVYSGFFDNTNDKRFILIDSWEGIDLDNLDDTEDLKHAEAKKDVYSGIFDEVQATFSGKKGVELVKGFVPQSLSSVSVSKVSYLHIDMNSVYPEISAIDFFWDKLEKGAIVILDDYGFEMHLAQKIAFDEFCSKKGCEVLSLPTGQGMIVKS